MLRRSRPTLNVFTVAAVAGLALWAAPPASPAAHAAAAAPPPPAGAAPATAAAGSPSSAPTTADTAGGPRTAYRCNFNVATDAFTGSAGTASAIGWLGDHNSVITCLGGTFVVQDGPGGLFQDYGFGLYDGQRTTWTDAGGYLPAQITSFSDRGARVSITEFADEDTFGGHPYVVVYARVRVANPTEHRLVVDPGASPALVELDAAPDTVEAGHSVAHDYAVVSDRFGVAVPWPTDGDLAGAGGFDEHYAHMRSFWNAQLATIAQVEVPDRSLADAYKAGFVTTQITRSGNDLDTGINGYESEFSHDVVGILTNLFTQGSFTDAHALLTEARNVVGGAGQYVDGLWTYALPWAVYLQKTGDTAFAAANFATPGPSGPATQPSIEDAAHAIASDRTGPDGTMEATDDIDTQGSWTTDDYEALLGLAAYRSVAADLGETAETAWATQEYASLLAATNAVLAQTIARDHLDYLPCSLLQPNTANRCRNPRDANWTSPLGNWAWESYLLGAPRSGPGLSLVDATYDYGFERLRGLLPPATTGGFPGDYYSSAYNAAQGTAGLAGTEHRDQGIVNYDFMLTHSQSGPFSWWESSSAPDPHSPWVGRHPATGQGSSPHAWGLAGADKVLLDSIVAQRSNGQLVVGRGIPTAWIRSGAPIAVANFPTTRGQRLGLRISVNGNTSITLTLRGSRPSGPVLFQLPQFVRNIASASSGAVNRVAGSVSFPPNVRRVTVTLRHAP